MLCAAAGCGRQASAPPVRDVAIPAADGATINASLYDSDKPNPPGLVLVPDEADSRKSWDAVARKAQNAGYTVVAVDLRGHGGSTGAAGSTKPFRDYDSQERLAAANDIAAAIDFLRQSGVAPDRTAVAGEGFGAALALYYAAHHDNPAALVLVSPDADDLTVKMRNEMAGFAQRPALLIAADGDAYAAASSMALKARASGLCEVRHYAGSAHGAAIFDASDTALQEMLSWLDQMVAGSK